MTKIDAYDMIQKDGWEDIIEEEALSEEDKFRTYLHPELSQAISLKRIADSLSAIEKVLTKSTDIRDLGFL